MYVDIIRICGKKERKRKTEIEVEETTFSLTRVSVHSESV